MSLSLIVVDANIIISALLKDSFTRKILLDIKSPKMYCPDFIKQELFKYLGEFSKRLKVKDEKLKEVLEDLFNVAEIEIIPFEKYSSFMKTAVEITPDIKDAPYLALALNLDCPVWSQDNALKKQSMVKVYSTKELVKNLNISFK